MTADTDQTRPLIDTHRHAFGRTMANKMAEASLYDPSAPYPQAGARDIVYYREFVDLDFAMHQQRQSGVTHTLLSNGGEIPWIAEDILETDLVSAIEFLTNDYLETMQQYPGEFSIMANAHALEESCRPAVERAIEQHGARAISVSSSYGDGADREFLDSPKAEWLWELATDKGLVIHVHPPMNATSNEVLGVYRLNEALGRPFDSTVNMARMIGCGLFDRHPALQMLVVHIGGDIASILGRMQFCWQLNYNGVKDPPQEKTYKNLRSPRSYLRTNFLVDCMGFNATALKAAVELLGYDRIVFGSDYGPVPFGITEHVEIVEAIAESPEQQDAIFSRNSQRVFGLDA